MGEKITYKDWLHTIMSPAEIGRLDLDTLSRMVDEELALSKELDEINGGDTYELWVTDPDTGMLLCDDQGDYIRSEEHQKLMKILNRPGSVGEFTGASVARSELPTGATDAEDVAIDIDSLRASTQKAESEYNSFVESRRPSLWDSVFDSIPRSSFADSLFGDQGASKV